jgi:TPR repeat protein
VAGRLRAEDVAALEKGCADAHVQDCVTLGLLYTLGDGVPADAAKGTSLFKTAVGLYDEACRRGDLSRSGCMGLALMHERGAGVPRDGAEAARLFQKACDGKDADACILLAGAYANGLRPNLAKDLARAAEFYQRACDLGESLGCVALAGAYADGTVGAKDVAHAAALYEKACELGDASGCTRVGEMYEAGSGVARDEARAAAAYGKACDGNEKEACAHLGDLYERGAGVSRDLARAIAAYEQGCPYTKGPACASLERLCEAGNLSVCSWLGEHWSKGSVSKDKSRAVHFYEKACDGADAAACAALAKWYQLGLGVPEDDARAAALYQKACEAGDVAVCAQLADWLWYGTHLPQDQARAVPLLLRACEGGEGATCERVGDVYAEGKLVPKDLGRAAALYTRGCEGGTATACAALGFFTDRGMGVPRDAARAEALYQRACDGGYAAGCASRDEVRAERAAAPEETASFDPEPALGHVAVRGKALGKNALTVRLRGVDLADVFKVLHEVTGHGFVVDGDVKGSVDVDVEGATLDETLTALKAVGVVTLPGHVSRVVREENAPGAPMSGRPYTARPVTFSFKDGALIDILRLYEDLSGLPVVTTPIVDGHVHVYCADTRWDEMLDVIAAANGMVAGIEGGHLFVLPETMAKANGQPEAVPVREAKTTLRRPSRRRTAAAGLMVEELALAGLSRVGTRWRAYAYGPDRLLWSLETGQSVFDGKVRAVGAQGLTFATTAGTRRLAFEPGSTGEAKAR